MKSVKNDTKYIIKRILIGVGIAIILFNLKKCNVYADSLQYRTFQLSSSSYDAYWKYSNSDISTCSYNSGTPRTFEYKGYKYNICYSTVSGPYKYAIAFEYDNDLYFMYGGSSYDTWDDVLHVELTNNGISVLVNNGNNSMQQAYAPRFFNGEHLVKINVDSDITYNNMQTLTAQELYTNDEYRNLILVYNNRHLPVYINGTYEVPDEPNPLVNLTQVDLTGYEGALIVPKSYEVMNEDYSSTQEVAPGVFHTNLNLSFYTQYCTRQTLVNLTNVKNLYTNNIGVSTGSLSASISGTCPTEPTETIMSYQYDMYSGMIPMGILLYNNEINDNGSFGTSYFWYDDDVYDIYMIESLDSFSADISFTDYDGTEKELKIEGLPTFLEMAEYALEHDTDLNKNKTNSLFSFIQAPFSFLNLIKTTKCTALRFPFPNSNQIIIIPCMSETYERIGGDLIYTISIIINGLIIYRCIISMIKVTECMLDADDDKLEVLEL